MRILVVEDEPAIAGFVTEGLRKVGHQVDLAGDLASAKKAVDMLSFDLIVVDRRLPDGDGLDLVRDLHRRRLGTPTLCLTARDRVPDRVEGLLAGADDYLIKPFAFEELVARITAVVRRRPRVERIELADLVIDVRGRRVERAGRALRLTAREYDLLLYLAERQGEVVERARLLQGVWDTAHDPGTKVIEVCVSYLRSKLDKGFDPPLLHTVRGVGYVLEVRGR